jgi:hypothetical protein
MKAISVSFAFMFAAFAQIGTIDQQYSGPFDLGDLCCESIGLSNLAVGQSFIPSQNYLTGISVHLRNSAGVARRVQLMLRAGSINGAIVQTSKSIVTVQPNTHDWVDFDFCPVRVAAGQMYVIQLLSENGGEDLSWSVRGGNPFLRGAGYRDSQVMPWDYGFRTYYMLEATYALTGYMSLTVPENVDRGLPFPARIDFQISVAPQGAFVPAFATGTIGNGSTVHYDSCKLRAGHWSQTFRLTPPDSLTPGPRDVTAQVGLHGFGLITAVRQVNVR